MKSKDTLIRLYHAGKLGTEDQALLEQMIVEDQVQLEELSIEGDVLEQLSDSNNLSDTQAMDDRFFTYLEKERTQGYKTPFFPIRLFRYQNLAAAVVITLFAFLGGLKLGSMNSKEGPPLAQQELLSSLLQTEDVSERIHLISTHKVEKELNKKILDVLLFSLINDESSNVRLACIEVLSQFGEEERVRESLIRSINHQHSTIVLVEIAQVLNQGMKRISVEEFFTYVNKEIHPVLKRNLEDALQQL